MEILIPGLILVAVMVWASTKIKKRAAEAFEAETIETDAYSIRKPEGFLHVLGSTAHDFEAYSKEYGRDEDVARLRRATIEIDAIPGPITSVRDAIKEHAENYAEADEGGEMIRIETEEQNEANESSIKVFYKLAARAERVYRLKIAVLEKHSDEFIRNIDETLDSFTVKTTSQL